MAKNQKLSSKKVAARKVVKAAAASLTSEQFKVAARKGEAIMAAVIEAETGAPVKGSNSVQALGQGKLSFKVNGERQETGADQLKGAFELFDSPKTAAITTAAVTGSDYPLDASFTRQGLVRIQILSANKLCANPADQKMVDAIWGAIAARYPEAVKTEPTARTRKPRGEGKAVSNPNPLFS